MDTEKINELEKDLDEFYTKWKSSIQSIRETLNVDQTKNVKLIEPLGTVSIAQRVRNFARQQGGIFTSKDMRMASPDLSAEQITNAIAILRNKGEITLNKKGSGRKAAVYQMPAFH